MVHAFARAAVLTVALLPAAAFAASPGSVTTDLNIRQGPGSNYPVVATIPAGGAVTIDGCVTDTMWCAVDYEGQDGFVYASYLTADDAGTAVVVGQRPSLVGVVTAPVTLATGATGTIVGAFTGGPTGTTTESTSSSFQALPNVVDYVRNNPPGDPIYLDGEAVPGAVVPEGVPLADVPDTDYQYANINGEPVVVTKTTRQVVTVVR